MGKNMYRGAKFNDLRTVFQLSSSWGGVTSQLFFFKTTYNITIVYTVANIWMKNLKIYSIMTRIMNMELNFQFINLVVTKKSKLSKTLFSDNLLKH